LEVYLLSKHLFSITSLERAVEKFSYAFLRPSVSGIAYCSQM